MPALSREEKNNLSFHLNSALIILFLFGIVVGIMGYLYLKPILIIIGSLTSSCPVIYLMYVTYLERNKAIEDLIRIPLKEISRIKSEVLKAEAFLKAYTVDGGIESCFVNKKDALNHLSLVRLVEGIKERIQDIEEKLGSDSLSKIEDGIKGLNSPLSFPSGSSANLINHEMPDIPKSSWIDSLHKLVKDLSNISH